MAKAGDVISSPALGETIRFIRTAADTGGAFLEVEATYDPQGELERGVEHYHPLQDERFEVLEGMLSVVVDGQERTYVAGERFDIPRGTVHLMGNRSSQPTTVHWEVRPALQTETFFETVWGLSADGKLKPGTLAYLLQFAVLSQAYGNLFRVPAPPYWVQRILFGVLAPLARLLGYRSRYEKYSGPDTRDGRRVPA